MSKSWDGAVLIADASVIGYSVCEADLGSGIAEVIGAMDERWRFKCRDGAELAPRSTALEAGAELSDVRSILPLVAGEVISDEVVDMSFPELPEKL